MNLTKPAIIAILAAMPSNASGQCPESGQLNECELALFETATTLDGKQKETATMLGACQAKLSVRTSTVIREIVKPCPEIEEPALNDWQLVLTTGLAGFVIGALAALLAS